MQLLVQLIASVFSLDSSAVKASPVSVGREIWRAARAAPGAGMLVGRTTGMRYLPANIDPTHRRDLLLRFRQEIPPT